MFVKFEEIQRMSNQIREITGDDQDTFLDTLDGETDAMDILGKLIQERTECSIYEGAAKELAATYTARAKRKARRNLSDNWAFARCYGRNQDPARACHS